MAQLDETITTGDLGHETDHETLARKANYVFDVKDFGAVGDGVTDDTAALDACRDAAHAASRGTMYFPLGTWMTDGLALSGTGVNIRGEGPGTVLKANAGIAGAVLDFNGWVNAISDGFFRDFSIEGDGVSDAGKTHYGMDTTDCSGAALDNIGIKNTGGPGWYSESAWGSRYSNITVSRPVDANTNDVPYIYFRGWINGNRFDSIGLNGVASGAVGSAGWLIEDDGTFVSHDSEINSVWLENLRTPENGAVFDFNTNGFVVQAPQAFDSSGSTAAQTGSCIVRFRPAVNGAGTDFGGNYLWGQIPARGTAAQRYAYGVELLQGNNSVVGIKGYRGYNVHVSSGVGHSFVQLGGRVSSATDPGWVDDSGETTNTLFDYTLPERVIHGVSLLQGSGSPESSETATVGSQYLRTDGGAGTTLYVKESGTGNTGWVAK